MARLLDRAKIKYELVPYEVDETDLGAQHIADQLGEAPYEGSAANHRLYPRRMLANRYEKTVSHVFPPFVS